MTSLAVNLTGPPPWGFRLSGGRDFGRPLTVSKVYVWSHAEQADLRPGDGIVEINGQKATEMLHLEAHNSIKNSTPELTLLVVRPKPVMISRLDPPAQKQIAVTKVLETRIMENSIDKKSKHPPNHPPTPKVLLSNPPPTLKVLLSNPPPTLKVLLSNPPPTLKVLLSNPPPTLKVLLSNPPPTPKALLSNPPPTLKVLLSNPPSTLKVLLSNPPPTPKALLSNPPPTPKALLSNPPPTLKVLLSNPPPTPKVLLSNPPPTPKALLSNPPPTLKVLLSNPPPTPKALLSNPPPTLKVLLSNPPPTPKALLSNPPPTLKALLSNPPPTPKALLSNSSPVRKPDRHVFSNSYSYEDIAKKRYPLPLASEVYNRIQEARDKDAAPLRSSFAGSREKNAAPLRSCFAGSREKNPAPLRFSVAGSREKNPAPLRFSVAGNRERSRNPLQSNTFYLLQEALQTDGQRQSLQGSRLQSPPGSRSASLLRVDKFHTCEACNRLIVTQAVRIRESRFRHQECYVCRDCGASLLRRGHFWVGEELYCGKHAQQRYRETT